TELKLDRFREVEVLHQVYIHVPDTRQAESVAAEIAVRTIRGTGESRRIQPLEAVGSGGGVAGQVGILGACVYSVPVACRGDIDRHAGLRSDHAAQLPSVHDVLRDRIGDVRLREQIHEVQRDDIRLVVSGVRIVLGDVEGVVHLVGVVVHDVHNLG